MVVCKFWERGNCRNGDACRFEHPTSDRSQGFSRQANAFEVLNRDSPGHGRGHKNSSPNRGFGQAVAPNKYKLDEGIIRRDLTEDLPVYIFSCYAPARDVPLNLFGGEPREKSYEEWRLRYYELRDQGNVAQAKAEEDSARVSAEQQIQAVLNDIPGAIRYIQEGENKHPNRFDVVHGTAQNEQQTGFESAEARQTGPAANSGNPFARPQQPAFGTSGFGNQQQKPAFGTPGFGGQQQTQNQQPNNPFARDAPQQMHQNQQPNNPFARDAPHQPPAANPFNVAAPQNSMAQMTSNNSAFKQNEPTAFPAPAGNPWAGGASNLFPSAKQFPQSTANTGANVFNNTMANRSPAGAGSAPAANPNPFARNGTGNANPGTGATPANPFARPTANGTGAGISGFGAQTGGAVAGSSSLDTGAVVLGPGDDAGSFTLGLRERRDGEARVFNGQQLVQFRGQPVRWKQENGQVKTPYYTDASGRDVRIWNVQPKDFTRRPADDPPQEVYTPEVVNGLRHMLMEKKFKDGVMPEFPLPRADTCFDI